MLTVAIEKDTKTMDNDEMDVSDNYSARASTSSRLQKSFTSQQKSTTSSRATLKKNTGPMLDRGDPLEPLPPWNFKKLDEINAKTQSQMSTVLQYSDLFPFLGESAVKVKPTMTGKSKIR